MNIEELTPLITKLADELVEMHALGAIELEYWETARLLVELCYETSIKVTIGEKRSWVAQ